MATSGLDEYLTRSEGGATQVYLTDALGSVVGLANSDGTVATTYAYDPNGTPTASGTTSTNPHTFTGREDDRTGLLYYRDRYYDPQTGRFISQDPSGQAGGTNLYQYALSSPTTYTDPTGNNPLIAGCVIGGLMDGGLDWLTQRLSGRKVNWGQVGQSAAIGCLSGMLGEGLEALAEGRAASRMSGCAAPNSFTGDTPVGSAAKTARWDIAGSAKPSCRSTPYARMATPRETPCSRMTSVRDGSSVISGGHVRRSGPGRLQGRSRWRRRWRSGSTGKWSAGRRPPARCRPRSGRAGRVARAWIS